ncbi:uncharacterized protein LOC113475635 isoform X1 [Ciona intestinalis]
MWGCEWKRIQREDPTAKAFRNKYKNLKKKSFPNKEAIIEGIVSGNKYRLGAKRKVNTRFIVDELYGLAEVDINVPQELKKRFAHYPPIFKNHMVSRDDIGQHMKEFAEANHIMRQPRRSLIGSFYGNKIFLTTPILKWYLKKGLVITRVYEFIE